MRLSLPAPVRLLVALAVTLGSGCDIGDECDPATYRANCDGDVYQTCNEGDLWATLSRSTCAQGQICLERDGSAGCVTPVPCTRPEVRCSDDGTSSWSCDLALGHFAVVSNCAWTDEPCIAGRCVDTSLGQCSEPGDVCSTDQRSILTCDETVGYLQLKYACPWSPDVCVLGVEGQPACVEASLTPCNTYVSTCAADGRFTLFCDWHAGYMSVGMGCDQGETCVVVSHTASCQ
jgi:hypothetical protein